MGERDKEGDPEWRDKEGKQNKRGTGETGVTKRGEIRRDRSDKERRDRRDQERRHNDR